jgi:hypothetical protein
LYTPISPLQLSNLWLNRNAQLIFFIFIFVSAPLFGFFIKNNDTFFSFGITKKEYLPAGNLAPSIGLYLFQMLLHHLLLRHT